jgi:hypothetical protein
VKPSEPVRISSLPRVTALEPIDATPLYKKGGSMELRPTQIQALTHAANCKGLVGLIGCGHGKTLITFLIPQVIHAAKPLLLLPASLIKKTLMEFDFYAQHFNIKLPHLLSYETLSVRPTILDEINPDVIIADEAHNLKSMASTRTSRLMKYIAKNRSTQFYCMSGTLLSKAVSDLAHLSYLALREGSPLPSDVKDLDLFDKCLQYEADEHQMKQIAPLLQGFKNFREAMFNRLGCTAGVVLSPDADANLPSLQFIRMKLDMPLELQEVLKDISETDEVLSCLGDMINLADIEASMHLFEGEGAVFRILSQLICGFIYAWDWDEPDLEWLEARKLWNKLLRKIVDLQIPDFDAPGLISRNFDSLPQDIKEVALPYKLEWDIQKQKPMPPKKVVWVSNYMIEAIKDWAKDKKDYIIWVDHQALGDKLATELSIPYYGGGVIPQQGSCICSIKAHGTGKNLQWCNTSLIADTLIDAALWEQLLARTHRQGQTADEVRYFIFDFSLFSTCFYRAIKQARMIEQTTGQPQRLVYGDKL